MSDNTRETLLKAALIVFGVIFLLVYPLGMIWPSGWVWHGGEGKYYLQMICGIYAVLGAFLINAARNPSEHRSLIWFTIWSSIVHALITAAQSISDAHEMGHLLGDVPALLLVAVVPWLLLPSKEPRAVAALGTCAWATSLAVCTEWTWWEETHPTLATCGILMAPIPIWLILSV
jgi:hypothetical protein